VHDESASPEIVLLRSLRDLAAALGRKLLGDGTDVVSLEAAAATDVPVERNYILTSIPIIINSIGYIPIIVLFR
jgi:hypothetical protein